MTLPHASEYFIDLAKLHGYSLSATHPEGKHKARVFLAAIGLETSGTEWLAEALRQAVLVEDCRLGLLTEFGQRYTVDFTVQRGDRQARIRSAWIVRSRENFPRLVSYYVL